jgi:hypothetical protein
MNVDDIVKIVLVLSVAFTLVGITVQIIRMMAEFIVTIREANSMVKNISTIVDKFTGDYDFISEQVKMILETISSFINTVFIPLTKVFGFMGGFEKVFNRKKSKKDKDDEDEE